VSTPEKLEENGLGLLLLWQVFMETEDPAKRKRVVEAFDELLDEHLKLQQQATTS
jgi:hypothetical protein